MAIIDDDITIIGVEVIIKGYDKRPRLVSINAGYNKLYKNDKTIRDLVAMCVQELGGLRYIRYSRVRLKQYACRIG